MSKLTFIVDNVNELMINDRKEILHIIYNSSARVHLKEKGGGTQIKLDDMPESIVNKIYDYMADQLKKNKIEM